MKQPHLLRQSELVVWYLLKDVSRIFSQTTDREMKKFGLSRDDWYLLSHAYYYDGLKQQDLADLMDVGKSSMARMAKKLEDRGWLQREADAIDGRAWHVTLTPAMRPIVRDMTELARLALKHAFISIDDIEIDQLVATMRKLERGLVKGNAKESEPEMIALTKSIAIKLGAMSAPRKRAVKK